jgi:prophage regulatory protein
MLIRLNDVIKITSLSRSTIYRHIKTGSFPKPVKVGDATIRWRENDVVEWVRSLTYDSK